MQNLTFLPFENTLINVSLLTHVVKTEGTLYLYFAGTPEDSPAPLTFHGPTACTLWSLLMGHERTAPPTRTLRF